MPEVRQEYRMHSLPSVFLMEAMLSDEMVNDLNEYLDDLLNQEDRASHAGTLVGQIGNGEQLTMDHNHPKLAKFNELIQIMGADYIKNFAGSTVNPFKENRLVETDELWSVHSFAGDYNPIHDHGTKTLMGISCTCWTKVPQQILDQPTSGTSEYGLYNSSGHSDGCINFQYGQGSLLDTERLRPPQMVIMKPEVGKFFMFPSWLQHSVYPFKGDGERRTVAANLNVWRIADDGTKH